jgi:hypothetical protein
MILKPSSFKIHYIHIMNCYFGLLTPIQWAQNELVPSDKPISTCR